MNESFYNQEMETLRLNINDIINSQAEHMTAHQIFQVLQLITTDVKLRYEFEIAMYFAKQAKQNDPQP